MSNPSKIAADIPQSTFSRGYDFFRYNNEVDGLRDFSIRLPNAWTAYPVRDARTSSEQPMTVLLTAHGANRDIEIVVWGAQLLREVNPADWLDGWLHSQNFRVRDMRMHKTSYGLLADVFAEHEVNGKTSVHRLATVKDGNRLFVLDGRSASSDGADVAVMQEIFHGALTAFQLANPTKERFAEPFAFWRLDGTFPLQFAASPSWTVTVSGNAAEGGTTVQYENRHEGVALGTIVIATSSQPRDSAALESVTLENLAANGITAIADGSAFAPVKNTPMNSLFGRLDAKRGTLLLEMYVLRAENEHASVSAIMVSPTSDTNLEAWAINRRAFEILVETMQPAN